MYNEVKLLFLRFVKQAIAQDELNKDTDPEATANMIMAFMNGFSIASKLGLSEEQLKAMAHNFLTQIVFIK